jgi:hypothetical protein
MQRPMSNCWLPERQPPLLRTLLLRTLLLSFLLQVVLQVVLHVVLPVVLPTLRRAYFILAYFILA